MILWTKIKQCEYALNTPLLEYIFVKGNICKNGRGCCAFSSAITRGTSEFIYKALILGNKPINCSSQTLHIVKPHKCQTSPELPSSQIAIYFA